MANLVKRPAVAILLGVAIVLAIMTLIFQTVKVRELAEIHGYVPGTGLCAARSPSPELRPVSYIDTLMRERDVSPKDKDVDVFQPCPGRPYTYVLWDVWLVVVLALAGAVALYRRGDRR